MDAIVSALIGACAVICAAWINSRSRAPAAARPADGPPRAERGQQSDARRVRRLGQQVRGWLTGGWALLGRLPPPSRRTRPWLAATLGFFFVGFGIMLYFRKLPDVLVGIALILPLGIGSSGSSGTSNDPALAWWWWIVAAIAGLYGLLRAESANRQLATIAPIHQPV